MTTKKQLLLAVFTFPIISTIVFLHAREPVTMFITPTLFLAFILFHIYRWNYLLSGSTLGKFLVGAAVGFVIYPVSYIWLLGCLALTSLPPEVSLVLIVITAFIAPILMSKIAFDQRKKTFALGLLVAIPLFIVVIISLHKASVSAF